MVSTPVRALGGGLRSRRIRACRLVGWHWRVGRLVVPPLAHRRALAAVGEDRPPKAYPRGPKVGRSRGLEEAWGEPLYRGRTTAPKTRSVRVSGRASPAPRYVTTGAAGRRAGIARSSSVARESGDLPSHGRSRACRRRSRSGPRGAFQAVALRSASSRHRRDRDGPRLRTAAASSARRRPGMQFG